MFIVSSLALAAGAEASPQVRDPAAGDKLARLSETVEASPGRPVVLFLGSSHTAMGFDAFRAEGRLRTHGVDARCFNLGLPAGGPVLELLMLNRALRAGVRPDVVIVELLPVLLHADPAGPREVSFLTGDRLSIGEVETLSTLGFARSELERRWARSRFAPWWEYRFGLWGRVSPSWLPFEVRADWGRTADAAGWNNPARDDVTEDERVRAEAKSRAEYADTLAKLSPGGGAVEAVRSLLAVCREHRTTVRLILLPESTAFRSLYGPGVELRLEAFLRELGEPVTDARGWRPDADFSDGHHLMRPGSRAFTDRLADTVLFPALKSGGCSHD